MVFSNLFGDILGLPCFITYFFDSPFACFAPPAFSVVGAAGFAPPALPAAGVASLPAAGVASFPSAGASAPSATASAPGAPGAPAAPAGKIFPPFSLQLHLLFYRLCEFVVL